MTTSARRLLLWGPRFLGILVGVFLSLFALDALDEGIPALLLHVAPAAAILLVVAAAWRWEWLGGTVFVGLAVVYGVMALRSGHMDWVLIVSGPLLIVGVLFLLSWRHHKELHAQGKDPGVSA
jgi:uncharacterized membrane protein YccC